MVVSHFLAARACVHLESEKCWRTDSYVSVCVQTPFRSFGSTHAHESFLDRCPSSAALFFLRALAGLRYILLLYCPLLAVPEGLELPLVWWRLAHAIIKGLLPFYKCLNLSGT